MDSRDDSRRRSRRRRERRLALRGIDYQLHEWGPADGSVIVMLHGWGDCGASFGFTAEALPRDYRVIAPDWRGFGDSGRNPAGYWFPDYLADLDELLEALGGNGPLPLVGHSMGANVAALYAGIRPERVAALVNIEGFGLADSRPDDAPRRYRQWLTARRQGREHPGYATLDELALRIRERSPGLAADRARSVAGYWARQDADGRWHLKADLAQRWPNPVLYRRAEAEACWRRIAAPILSIRGAASDAAAGADEWERIAGADESVTLADAGHMLHLEQPERLADAIAGFLARVLPGL